MYNFFLDLFKWLVSSLWNSLVDLVNGIVAILAGIVSAAVSLLPDGYSFDFPTDGGFYDIASSLNWILPMGTFVSALGVIALAYAGYFAVRPFLKFFQVS